MVQSRNLPLEASRFVDPLFTLIRTIDRGGQLYVKDEWSGGTTDRVMKIRTSSEQQCPITTVTYSRFRREGEDRNSVFLQVDFVLQYRGPVSRVTINVPAERSIRLCEIECSRDLPISFTGPQNANFEPDLPFDEATNMMLEFLEKLIRWHLEQAGGA